MRSATKRIAYAAAAAVLLAAAIVARILAASPGAPSTRETPASPRDGAASAASPEYRRIIAFSPAITEIVYALGAEDRLVGIAGFSDWPPRARLEKPEVGGILNIDIEKVLSLRPDLVITPPGAMISEKLARVGAVVRFVPDKTLDDVASSFTTIGELVGKADEGRALEKHFRSALDEGRARNAASPPARTLMVIGYEPLYVAGGYGFLNEILEAAGGVNAAGSVRRDFFSVDIETIIGAQPQLIIDLSLDDAADSAAQARINAFWRRFAGLPAVRDRRIVFIDTDYLTIPGPRLLEGLTALEAALAGAGGEAAR